MIANQDESDVESKLDAFKSDLVLASSLKGFKHFSTQFISPSCTCITVRNLHTLRWERLRHRLQSRLTLEDIKEKEAFNTLSDETRDMDVLIKVPQDGRPEAQIKINNTQQKLALNTLDKRWIRGNVVMADIMDEILRIFFAGTAKRNVFSLDLSMLQKMEHHDAVVLSGALVDFLSFVYCREKGLGDMGLMEDLKAAQELYFKSAQALILMTFPINSTKQSDTVELNFLGTMDRTAFVPLRLRINSSQLDDDKERESALGLLIKEVITYIKEKHQCQIDGQRSGSGNQVSDGIYEYKVGFVVWGSESAVERARRALLNINVSQARELIKVRRAVLLDRAGEMRLGIKEKLEQVMKETKTLITCVGRNDELTRSDASLQLLGTGLEIEGPEASVRDAKVRSLVMLDMTAGLHCATLRVDANILPLILGIQRKSLRNLVQISGTNIYISSAKKRLPNEPTQSQVTMFITGKKRNVISILPKIEASITQKRSFLKQVQVDCQRSKLDWTRKHKNEELNKIMLDNAVFIEFPEDDQTPISVFGESLVFIHRAIRMFQELMTDLSQVLIQLKSAIILPFEVSDLRKYPDTSNIKTFYRIALETGADIMQYKTSIEIWGHRSSINQAYVQIMQQPWIKKNLKSTKFQIELAEAHRDFLNGKKNGKLNKIMNASGCRLVLHESYNGYNFLIDLYEDLEQEYLQGIQLLEDELPAELSFFIPEPLHKRIIGVGGKNIQKIMKQFGVFVKFSNMGEFKEIGGYQENTHNVIARTPAKNAENLGELRACIIDSIQEDIERLTDTVDIPRELHRILNAFYATIIRSSELDNDAKIEFPDKENASEEVTLSAYNEKKLEVVKRTLLKIIPKMAEFDIPRSTEAVKAVRSPEFQVAIQKLENEMHLSVEIYCPSTANEELLITIIHRSDDNMAFEKAKTAVLKIFEDLQVNTKLPDIKPTPIGSYVNIESSSPPQIDAFVHFDDRTGGSRRNLNEPKIETLLSLSKNSAHSMPDLRHLFVSEANNSNQLENRSQGGLKKSESELAPPPQDNSSGYRLIKSPKPPGTDFEGLWGHPSPEPGNLSQGVSGIESMLSLDFGAPGGTSGGDKGHHHAFNGSKLNMGLSKQDLMDDDDVLVNYFSEDVIDQLFNQHTASAYSHDQTYLFLETLGLTSFFHVFITANIPFFKVLRLNETELRNLNVQPFDVRQRVINASQQCLAKYEFSPPFYPETSPYPKHKTASSRFFKEPAPETLPLSGATNSSHASHPSP